MNAQYVNATPELKARFEEQSSSNASDFIRFDDSSFSVVAIVDDKPVGLIAARKRCLSIPLEMVQEAFIDIIEVHPDYRRNGIGTVLVDKVVQWARENQASQIRAWSEEIRHEALMLWHKTGFTFSQVDFQRGEEKRYGFYVAKRI